YGHQRYGCRARRIRCCRFSRTVLYCSRGHRSASSRVFQKLRASTRSRSASETSTISSTKPACFFSMGTTCSLMALDRSLDFPDLLVSSTALVNMCAPFVVEGARNRRWRDDGKELLVG